VIVSILVIRNQYDDHNDEYFTGISSTTATDDPVSSRVKATSIAVLISTPFPSRTHAWTTRVSGTRPRVTIVTVSAPA